MEKEDIVEEQLKKYDQENILELMSKLDNTQKQDLIEQVLKIDFDEMKKLYEDTKKEQETDKGQITPIDYVDKEKMSEQEKKELQEIGEQLIKNDQYAVVTMAGGQGTRLGCNGPKGTFKLNIGNKEKYIFEILTENLKKSEKLYNILPYWYIMTSIENNEQTIEFFERNNYFGYNKEKVKFFKQDTLPLLTPEGKLVIENNQIKTASNGNGGVYLALKKQNMIEDMKSKNIKYAYICGVDNILVNPIDPIFIGLTIKQKMQIASKSIVKAYPEEKVGVFCKRDGKPSVIEYIDITEEMRTERNEQGELVYGEGTFVSHLLTTDVIEKIANKNLEYHLAIKNNLYKFETFIFDGFKFMDDMLVMRVKREDEFAPIKNKEGIDSPETAKEIYEKKYIGK